MPFLLIMNRLNSTRHGENLQGIECCRTCLRSENLTDIFHSKNFMIKRMQQLKITTGLTVSLPRILALTASTYLLVCNEFSRCFQS